ncbi:MAG: MFS transporter, partial [Pseudomonadales bacterium]
NRKLVLICITVQLLSLGIMALAESYALFLAASTILGFFTLTPYLLPAYVSKRVEGAQLGRATATLTTGVVAGVLLSRTGSGIIAEYGGWRTVYGVATGLMALTLVILAWRLEGKTSTGNIVPGETRYGTMMRALGRLALTHPRVLLSGAIQGLSFAIFLLLWLGLGLHLTGAEWKLGTDVVGALAALTALNLLTTAKLGRWADGHGPERARRRLAILQFIGVGSLALVHLHWLWVILPITLTSIAGPVIDVTGRMTALREDPAIRTRLMTLYTTIMFLLAGLGSALGTSTYAAFGWNGIVLASSGLSLLVVVATHLAYRLQPRGDARP